MHHFFYPHRKFFKWTSSNEINIMKKTVSSVESMMHRAKSNLQNYLYEYYSSDHKVSPEMASK